MSEADRSWLALINYRVLRTGRRSADGVPAFRHWNETPGKLVVVGSLRQRIESRRVGQEVLLRRNGCSHGIQQTVEFNFTHHALRVRERSISKDICGQIEVIDQIVSIRQPERTWLLILYRAPRVGRLDPSQMWAKSHPAKIY